MKTKKNKTPTEQKSKIESMTGFGEARSKFGEATLICRIKSLNHRFLDLKVRLPRADLLSLDMAIRKRASEVFKRGAMEITLAAETSGAATQTMINDEVAKAYIKHAQQLTKLLNLKTSKKSSTRPTSTSSTISIDALMRLPGVIVANASTEDNFISTLNESEILSKLIEPAFAAIKRARLQEGLKLRDHLLGLLTEMDSHLQAIESLEQPEKEKARQLMVERAQETLKLLNSAQQGQQSTGASTVRDEFSKRLNEEAVFWIERRDFEEERMRLGMHLKSFRSLISSSTDEVSGRKLEFLQQEILREINTLGTKAQNTSVTEHTIELKTLLERIREQLANVE